MQRKMLVFIAALALPGLSHAYTVGKYTNSTCLALAAGSADVTVATDACAAPSATLPATGTSVKLPNNNCPLVGGFWVNEYADSTCSGTALGPIQFTSGVCTAFGTNWYKITCSLTDNTTTTTEMKFGLPWWFWLLLYCLLCCCCALCGGGGAIPFLGGKKKPTKKPAAATPSVVEEVITVEDEAAPMVTAGYPTASMAVPMATTTVPMGAYPGAYPSTAMAY